MVAPASGHGSGAGRRDSAPEPPEQMVNRFGPDFTCLYVNEALARIHQTTPQEMIGRNWLPLVVEDQRDRVRALIEGLTPERPMVSIEHPVVLPTGEVRWQRWVNCAVFDPTGRVLEYQAVGTDITDQRRISERLHILSSVVEQSNEGVAIADLEGRLFFVNRAFAEAHGYQPEELLGRPLSVFHTPEQMPAVEAANRQLRETGEFSGEIWHARRDGSVFPALMHNALLRDGAGHPIGLIGTLRDISERKRAEEALRASEQRLEMALAAAAAGTWTWDAQTGQAWWDDRYHAMYGFAPHEPRTHEAWLARLHPGDRAGVLARLDAMLKTPGDDDWDMQFRALLPDGRVAWMHGLGRAERDAGGQVVRIMGINLDITERRQAEEALLASEQRYRALAEAARDMIYIIGRDDRVEYVNSFAAASLGRPPEQVVGQPRSALFPPEAAQKQAHNLRRVFDAGEPLQAEDTVPFPTGHSLWMHTSLTPLRNDAGEVVSVLGISRDITERKRAEEALRESEKKYRDLIETTGTGFVIVDPQGRVLDANAQYVRLTGHEHRHDILGRCVTEWTAPDEVEMNRAAVQRCYEQGSIRGFVVHYVDRSGNRTPIEVHATVVQGPDGPQILTLCHDITERRRAEDALRASEERYRAVTENAPDAIFCKDAERRYTFCNPALLRLLGRTPEQVLGKTAEDVLTPEGAQLIREPDEATLHGETINRVGTLRLRDEERVFHTVQVPLRDKQGRVVGLTGISRDITQQQRTADALRASEERYRAVTENAMDAIFCKDAERRYTFINPAAARLLGLPAEQILGKTPEEVFEAPDAAIIREVDDACFQGEIVNAVRTLHRGGREFLLHTVQVPLRDQESRVVGITGVVRDLTGQRRLADDLRASEAAYRTIFDAVTDAILLLDCETGADLEMNAAARAYARRLGRPLVVPLALEFLASPEEPFSVREALRRVHAAARGHPQNYEWMLRDPDGHPVWFLVNLAAANIRGLRCVLAVARETTELRRAQDERLRIQKLESLGLLAGGIAHDFNNLLMGILASIALARMDEAASPELAKTLDDAEKAVRRATGLTHQLLTFSRGGAPVRRVTALGELVRDTAEFALTGSNVRAHFQIPDNLWPAEVDAAQIGQVIQNLVINAHEAMPDGGVVRLTAANVLLGPESGIPLPPGRYVKLAVRDTGIGIPPENLQRVFDPYFTTKGAGSGLGLAVAYSVLRSHGGHIQVESQLGLGSTFEVFLPAAAATAPPGEPPPERARRQGRLLVMDDDVVIRRCIEQLLVRVGYTVACAPDGAEAVRVFREALERGQPFDAVVLDLTVVDGMGGEACLAQLRALDPDVRAIVASGFHTDPVMAEFRARGFRAVVAKPFSLDELVRAIDEARA